MSSNHQCKYLSLCCTGEATRGSNLQDILRLLTLWFQHGFIPDVEKALEEGFSQVSIDTWLVVIPQVFSALQPITIFIGPIIVTEVSQLAADGVL
jgi:FKBP12-rapamycin complex-associated protein